MTILATDIKLLESERMADTTDGGGRRTSRVIPDGVAGNIFPKVSRLDTVYGRVNLRKVYGAVQTSNLDTYAGAHAIITDAPDNAKINTTLFSTASEFDTRTAARDRIESFVASGPESRMILLGRQLVGQTTVVVYQRLEAPMPEVGDVYCLSTEVGGTVTAQQYFRVQTVAHEIRTFTETIGSAVVDFDRRVITLGTGSPLRTEFIGPETASQLSNIARPTKVRSTSFVDAARYYGIQPLAAAVEAGDLSARLASIYTQLVPTTTRETALSNASPASTAGLLACANAVRTDTLVASGGWAVSSTRRALRSIKPGSAVLSATGMAAVTDDGAGAFSGDGFVGTVDYETGLITRTGGASGASAWQLAYMPAVAATQIAHTRDVYISLATRGLTYSMTLNPLPAPGSVSVAYRALNKWYTLNDNGAGVLLGDEAAFGRAEIDYATGSLTVTLGALPDVASALLFAWGSPTHYVIRAGETSDSGVLEQRITLSDVPVDPGSLELTYTSGGTDYSATDNGSGVIAGNGITGSIDYTSGAVLLRFATRLPDALSAIQLSFDQREPSAPGESITRTVTVSAALSMSLGGGVVAGTLTGALPMSGKSILVKDNGSGLLLALGGQAMGAVEGLEGAVISGDQSIGTVNYGTGAVEITGGIIIAGNRWEPQLRISGIIQHVNTPAGYTPVYSANPNGAGEWVSDTATATLTIGGSASFGFQSSGISATLVPVDQSVSFATAPLRFPLRTSVGDNMVPGSLIFTIGGKTYIDRNGTLYADVSAATGVGMTAGAIDYNAGTIALSYWANGATPTISVQACLSIYGEYSAAEVYLRTAGSPLRPGSFYVQATDVDGNLLTGQANNAGEITGPGVEGYVDQETGIFRLRFGEVVSAAGNESAWWYDADNVVAGEIWRPALVIPSTIRYNAVILTSLPLNADLLGLDPVRLPSDGRVPIFRPSDVAVLHNTQGFTLPNPAVAGATYSVGRTDLAELWLEDQAGVKVDPAKYEYDLDVGSVTMASPLSLTGYTQPLVARHRVEDMVLISDVQINGQVAFDPALSRDYPVDGTFMSSAVLFGDMVARVTNVFDLLTWSAWSDTPGPGASAEYNTIDYPVEVLNNGAVTERWRINFTSTTTFQVIGENLGVIATGSIGEDCAPANALTSQPYFVIRAAGWGMGWSAGNQLRFNTISAAAPIWVARTILPGASLAGDAFALQLRGDVDDA